MFQGSPMDSVVEFYKVWQPDLNTLYACLPEMVLCLLALLALVFDVACKSCAAKRVGSGFIRAALIALFICSLGGAFPQTEPEAIMKPGLFYVLGKSTIWTTLFIACAFGAINLSRFVRSREINAGISAPATTHLILIATAAASLLLKTTSFVAFFVLLETLTVCLYALVGSNRNSAYSLEAGVKYLIAGGVSGGIMLFGIVLLYGASALSGAPVLTGDPLSYGTVYVFLMQNPDSIIGLVGAGLVIAGVMFKLGVFPMQFWIPDVYQGAPTHVTFFLATVSKAAGFFLMLPMLMAFDPLREKLSPVLLACALVSMVYANLTALGQRNVKRLLGLSGVSHAAYLMVGLLGMWEVTASANAGMASVCVLLVVAYIVVYILTVYPIFSVMVRMPQKDDALQNFDDYEGLSKNNPLLAGTLAFGLGSLAGIPPTVGFIAKLGILFVLFQAGFYWTIAVMLACVVASIYYYFGWFRAAFIRPESAGEKAYLPVGICSRIVLVALSALMVLASLGYWWALRGI
jgi:NADH-quinone oxidoreductase subunit N